MAQTPTPKPPPPPPQGGNECVCVVTAAIVEAAGKVAAAKISKWSSGQEARDQSKKDVEDAFLDVLNTAKHHKLIT